jgi:hypothetical protein
MAASRRLLSYVIAFAGLLAALYAVTGLLALFVTRVTLRANVLVGVEDMRSRVSFYLAALLVGAPLWLGFWLSAQRRARAVPDERNAPERRLFLGAVFATTSVVALFALHTLLATLLTLPGPVETRRPALDGILAGARLLVYGAAWLGYARIGWRELSPQAEDAAHDLAVYVLSGFALGFLATGVVQALRQLIGDILRSGGPTLLGGSAGSVWTVWGSIAALILSGGLTWAAVWQYDLERGRRELRAVYLYLVLLIAVPTTLGSATDGLYELLRRLFGYREARSEWSFLRDVVPLVLVGGGVWIYHWGIVRRQAAFDNTTPAAGGGSIPWPRRPAIALLVAFGLALVAPALVSVLWLGLDWLLNTGASLSGPAWWRDRLSLSVAAGLVGTGAWLGGWTVLQRAAAAAPQHERDAVARRRLLAAVVLVSALVALGFGIALLWLILQTLLGARLDVGQVSNLLKYLSAVAVALGLVAYHGLILRRDRALVPTAPRRKRVVALVAPGAEEALATLRQRTGLPILVAGRLGLETTHVQADLPRLEELLANLDSENDGQNDSLLLLLRPDGGSLHAYTRLRETIG